MSGTNSQRVGEIFTTAGLAFNTLGELTKQLESSGQNATKWTDQEINMLQTAVLKFTNDLQVISDTIKSRTVCQIKGALQKKAFDEAGIIIQPQQVVAQSPITNTNTNTHQITSTTTMQNSDVTLNALNASAESEVDVEGMATSESSALEFDSVPPPADNV
jgi:hypothetical protein